MTRTDNIKVDSNYNKPGAAAGARLGASPVGFENAIAAAINFYSKESNSGTPDFILARYLTGALALYDEAVSARAKWCEPSGNETAQGNLGPLHVELIESIDNDAQRRFYIEMATNMYKGRSDIAPYDIVAAANQLADYINTGTVPQVR